VSTPGWFPDPSGRHEFRYFNGQTWTGDVARGGQRYVDPLGTDAAPAGTPTAGTPTAGTPTSAASSPDPGGNTLGVAALSCGILAIALGWIPVVFVAGAVLAVLAVVFGSLGIKHSRLAHQRRGFAIAGVVTGVIGILVAVAGLIFTVAVFRALERYENPGDNQAGPLACQVLDGRLRGSGEIQNLGSTTADYTVLVDLVRGGSGIPISTRRERIEGVEPGEIRTYEFSQRVTASSVECRVAEVKGPLPFGVVVNS
jgi:hypothetical protein